MIDDDVGEFELVHILPIITINLKHTGIDAPGHGFKLVWHTCIDIPGYSFGHSHIDASGHGFKLVWNTCF